MTLAQLDLGLPHVATFPCNADKTPITQRGFKDAIRGMRWRSAPLVGFPTGAVNGVDVLDIDGDAGRSWYDAHRDRLPLTQTHSTRRGKHFLFHHAAGLRCSESRIAPGVDVKADGGYVVWWPREGFAVEDAEIADWPEWLLEAARRKPRLHEYPSTSLSSLPLPHGDVASLLDGLRRLDPVEWRKYDPWLELMMASKAAGIDREDFVAWSTSDPVYRNDADVIAYKWDGVPARHSGALFAALAASGIKYKAGKASRKDRSAGVPLQTEIPSPPSATPAKSPSNPALAASSIGLPATPPGTASSPPLVCSPSWA